MSDKQQLECRFKQEHNFPITTPIDDVYDEKVFLQNYELYTLKKGNVLNYAKFIELTGGFG